MSKTLKTVTQVVWSNIASNPDAPAALVKNEGPAEYKMVAYAAGPRPVSTIIDARPAVVAVSWNEYGHMVAEVVLYLREQGVRKGDRIALLGSDSLEWMVLNRAVQCIGAIVVPIYDVSDEKGVAHIINDSTPVLLLSESEALHDKKVRCEMLTHTAVKHQLFADACANFPDYTGKTRREGQKREALTFRAAAQAEFATLVDTFTTDGGTLPFADDDVCTLIYTSGSTSLPKGAMLTHKNIAASCEMLHGLGFDFTAEDHLLHYL
ncbi:MAG: AMP-binding protein, partial [Terriglobales bacterium]